MSRLDGTRSRGRGVLSDAYACAVSRGSCGEPGIMLTAEAPTSFSLFTKCSGAQPSRGPLFPSLCDFSAASGACTCAACLLLAWHRTCTSRAYIENDKAASLSHLDGRTDPTSLTDEERVSK